MLMQRTDRKVTGQMQAMYWHQIPWSMGNAMVYGLLMESGHDLILMNVI